MKRLKDSDIIPLIVAAPNIRQAIFAVLRGTDRKESPQGREILAHIDGIEAWLAGEISAGIFHLTTYGEEEIKEGGKIRKIQFLYSYYEKIGVHAIMNIVEDLTFKRLIRTTAASLKNRGVMTFSESYGATSPLTPIICFMSTRTILPNFTKAYYRIL